MDNETTKKSSLSPLAAMLCGLFTAFGCAFIVSDPATQLDADLKQDLNVKMLAPQVVATAYHDVQSGSAHPAQMPKISNKPRLGLPPEIVIKLKDKTEAKRICDMFWKNKEAGRLEFRKAIADRPELSGLQLKRVTYSNEFVVDIAPLPELSASDLKSKYAQAVKSLKNLPNIAYAEPNATAQPGNR